jgi:hypothetical protein
VAAGFGLAPAVWFAHLLAAYLLVPVACDEGTLPIHAATAAAAVAALVGWVAAARGQAATDGVDAARFLLRAGRVMSPVFAAVIVLTGVAAALVDPCG